MPADPHPPHPPLLYVSYAWGDDSAEGLEREAIVDNLCSALRQDGLEVGRDKRRQKFGDSIEGFAADIARADLVLLVVSKKYLRSYHCMVEELAQIYRRCNRNREEFQYRTCLLLLDDAFVDIRVTDELKDHWQDFKQREEKQLQELDPGRTSSPHAWQALANTKEMISCLKDILSALRDPVMPRGTQNLSEDGFEAIRQLVRQRLNSLAQWRRQRSSLIPQGPELQAESSSSVRVQPRPDVCFLALVFERGKKLVDNPDWNSPEPWRFHAYQWTAYTFDATAKYYKVVDGLAANLRPTVVAPKDDDESDSMVVESDSMVKASTFTDLLAAAEAWLGEAGNHARVVLELFVPDELLLFDWSSFLIPCDADPRRQESCRPCF